jgi:hypothetical protein
MSWKSDLAIKRIFNSFKRLKTQIFTQDIDALKLLNETISESEKMHVNDNLLFAKLLCTALRYRTENYGNIKSALKSLKNDLETPLNHQIEFLQLTLNRVDDVNYLKSIGVDLNNENFSEIKELNGHEKEFLEKLKTNWTYEKVYKSFMNSANDFLKDINNYV